MRSSELGSPDGDPVRRAQDPKQIVGGPGVWDMKMNVKSYPRGFSRKTVVRIKDCLIIAF